MTSAWRFLYYNQEAADEVASLYLRESGKYDEDREHEVWRILNMLASRTDPRHPGKESALLVTEINSIWFYTAASFPSLCNSASRQIEPQTRVPGRE